jgi:hydrophobic/amphiphilic exporter-1 (mainly G- bacteria), HAE1 family
MLLRPRSTAPPHGPLAHFFRGFNSGFARAQKGYVSLSGLLIRRIVLAIAILLAFTVLAGGIGKILPRSFLPDEDQGYFIMNVELPAAASLQRTNAVMRKIDDLLQHQPGVLYYNAISGFSILSQTASSRNGVYFCLLSPYEQRRTAALQAGAVVAAINQKLAGLPDAQSFAFLPPAIPGIGQASGVDFFVQDYSGGAVSYLWENTQKFLAAARKRPELARMNLVFSPAVPQMFAAVDKNKAFKLGIPIQSVYAALQTLLGRFYVNQFNRFGRVWKVFVEAEPQYRARAKDVGQFYVTNNAGTKVPLSTLVDMRRVSGPEYTTRFNEYRSIEIFAAPAPGYSTGDAMEAITQVANQVLPRDMGTAWNGISYQQSVAGGAAGVFGLSLLLVFLILAALYESWMLPLSVLLSVPVAVCGAFFGLWFRHLDNDVYAQIGLIMLIGLSAKNAILIVEFARAELDKGESIVNAALNGARLRLRPILMTSFAFVFGLMPLWTALGAGGVARRLIGTVTIVGMAFSSAFAIFLVPMLFVIVQRAAYWWRGEQPPGTPARATLELPHSTTSEPERAAGSGV